VQSWVRNSGVKADPGAEDEQLALAGERDLAADLTDARRHRRSLPQMMRRGELRRAC
jgi:hypothetical protein